MSYFYNALTVYLQSNEMTIVKSIYIDTYIYINLNICSQQTGIDVIINKL